MSEFFISQLFFCYLPWLWYYNKWYNNSTLKIEVIWSGRECQSATNLMVKNNEWMGEINVWSWIFCVFYGFRWFLFLWSHSVCSFNLPSFWISCRFFSLRVLFTHHFIYQLLLGYNLLGFWKENVLWFV